MKRTYSMIVSVDVLDPNGAANAQAARELVRDAVKRVLFTTASLHDDTGMSLTKVRVYPLSLDQKETEGRAMRLGQRCTDLLESLRICRVAVAAANTKESIHQCLVYLDKVIAKQEKA